MRKFFPLLGGLLAMALVTGLFVGTNIRFYLMPSHDILLWLVKSKEHQAGVLSDRPCVFAMDPEAPRSDHEGVVLYQEGGYAVRVDHCTPTAYALLGDPFAADAGRQIVGNFAFVGKLEDGRLQFPCPFPLPPLGDSFYQERMVPFEPGVAQLGRAASFGTYEMDMGRWMEVRVGEEQTAPVCMNMYLQMEEGRPVLHMEIYYFSEETQFNEWIARPRAREVELVFHQLYYNGYPIDSIIEGALT